MKSPSKNSAALTERLNASGLRPTPQREVVFKVILEKRDHPTADEIFARVKAEMPTISHYPKHPYLSAHRQPKVTTFLHWLA